MGNVMRLSLVSCTKKKQKVKCKASEMYMPSALFKAAYQYAVKNYDLAAILSAKYGLLMPEDEIEPYDLTLKTMSVQQRKQWAEKVFRQLKERIDLQKISECFFHAGKEYRKYLILMLENAGVKCHVPLEGLSIGEQLQWYKMRNPTKLLP
ncbi:MAG: hypothetical protein QXH37_04850 [Candidatus Bathyarchaeia archaeon]